MDKFNWLLYNIFVDFRKESKVMIKDKTSSYQDRNLSEVFKELQEIKNNSQLKTPHKKHIKHKNSFKIDKLSFSHARYKYIRINLFYIIMLFIIITFFIFCNKKIFAKSIGPKYELNDNSLDIQRIVSNNANINTFKEQSITEYDLISPIVYTNNPTLPKGEEVVTKEGTLGKENVLSVKAYQNQQLIEEHILSREKVLDPTPQLVDVGTSELLANYKIHIGDSLYLLKDCSLKELPDAKSNDLNIIKQNLDVKLLELLNNETWCKISFNDKTGYIPSSELTSAFLTPDIVEKNRITKIMLEVDIDMPLNTSSNLTIDDFKKLLTDLPQDKNNIFKDNYNIFYEMDKKYNINGVFLASIAIHESNYGTSTISKDKKNLFGYGAYDRNPYEYSIQFEDYNSGIETVAKSLAKYYLNPKGTTIYENEIAKGSYYNGPTVKDVNIRYASDPEWHTKVFKYMELLYGKLLDGDNK